MLRDVREKVVGGGAGEIKTRRCPKDLAGGGAGAKARWFTDFPVHWRGG